MNFSLVLSSEAVEALRKLEFDRSLVKRFNAVKKTLGYLQSNPRHPSLNTHKFNAYSGMEGQVIFEAYEENHTPGACRIFWHYGPNKNVITVIRISVHP